MKKLLLTFLLLTIIPSTGFSEIDSTKANVIYAGDMQAINTIQKNFITYISISQLVEILGGQLNWEILGHTISFSLPEIRLEFVLGSPYFKLNNTIHNITYPTILKKGQLFLPAETFIPFLDRIMSQKFNWNRATRTLRITSEYFNVSDLSITKKANGILIEIFLTKALEYDIAVTEGNWINVFITDGRVNTAQIRARKDSRYMRKLSAHQSAGAGQVSIRMKRSVAKMHHTLASDPPRIQISIADEGFTPQQPDSVPQVGPDNKIDVIVVDAGHGGRDYGAIGPGKTREKDVVLGIAKELAALIRKDKQFKVVMTRSSDKAVSLEKRAEIANNAGGDLFISIHANASPRKKVRGWNVFFLASARNDSARAVAQFENSFFLREGSTLEAHRQGKDSTEEKVDPVMNILNEMIMTEFQAESHDFALMVAKEFHRNLKIPARGVDQAGFFVLNKVFTPSVLLEVGFISNKKEEKLIKKSSYQKKVANAVYKAIKRFKIKYEKK